MDVEWRGKYLLFWFCNGMVIVYLGMFGSMCIMASDELSGFYDYVDMVFSDGCRLWYCDLWRFGVWLWIEEEFVDYLLIVFLGLEFLMEVFYVIYLYGKFRGCKSSIKVFIMDSYIVVGVGNIYVNEVLFMVGIYFKWVAGKVSVVWYEKLV